jgi:hypothetical protein
VLHHAYPVYQRMKRRAKGRVFAIEKRGRTGKSKSLYLGSVASYLMRGSAQSRIAGTGRDESSMSLGC